jgi:truncated hemoglobin YjbI
MRISTTVDASGMPPAVCDSPILLEATRLAADGELGSSDAITLLQIPHESKEIRAVLQRFAAQLSREAKSKLALEALVPRPASVANQRHEPLFDKYVASGETYTTANGAVVPNELQYYNGEMAHLHGECANIAAVSEAVAGSGYRPVIARYQDGRDTAVAQLWSSRFTDSTLGPYAAMFIVIPVVPMETPAGYESITADLSGVSSVVAMLNGTFDATTNVYTNKARLFMYRLVDTTQVAIDFGRERMGTDKRPGTLEMTSDGRNLRLLIKDGEGHGVVKAELELLQDPASYLPVVANAVTKAGVSFRTLPRGIEFCYDAVARIGRGPIVKWQWHSDLAPRLQPIKANSVRFDSSSEEGRILNAWGFTPRVLGYIPNVRGVITGLAPIAALLLPRDVATFDRFCDRTPTLLTRGTNTVSSSSSYRTDQPAASGAPVSQRARDGSLMTWGTRQAPSPPRLVYPGASVPFTVAVAPFRPGHAVAVDYRVNGGPVRQIAALPELPGQAVDGRLFHATLPAQSSGVVEFLPILRFAGQPISPGLSDSREVPSYTVGQKPAGQSLAVDSASTCRDVAPKWEWGTTFLATLKATLRKEVVGATSDGVRINWHVKEGSFAGPQVRGIVLPGAVDWMRIRPDGIGVMSVEACLETSTGVRIYASYAGHCDFGLDGYARALRDDFSSWSPVVVTPTFATADPQLAWLNRAVCIGVGRVKMSTLRVEFDIYVANVGDRASDTKQEPPRYGIAASTAPRSLYSRMGGYDVIAPMTDDFIASIVADDRLGRFFVSGYTKERLNAVRQNVVDFFCRMGGGPCFYTGRDMKTTHAGMGITKADWTSAAGLLTTALTKFGVGAQEQSEFMRLIEEMKPLIVELP